jgi:hypothetical protein
MNIRPLPFPQPIMNYSGQNYLNQNSIQVPNGLLHAPPRGPNVYQSPSRNFNPNPNQISHPNFQSPNRNVPSNSNHTNNPTFNPQQN